MSIVYYASMLYFCACSLGFNATVGQFFHPAIPAMCGGSPIERCGAELLSALLPEEKMRESPVFRYFS